MQASIQFRWLKEVFSYIVRKMIGNTEGRTVVWAALFSRLAQLLSLLAALLLAIPAHADESLTYDANGNIQSRTLPGGTTQYGYDDLDRLTSESGPAKSQSITYDANDNRLSDGSGSKTYTANTNQLATANGQTVTRDKAGNITQIRGLSLEWNQAGQLKTVKQGSTQLATYFYDYKGRRSRKVTPTETTIYFYDLWDHLIVEFDGKGIPLKTYVWRDDIPVAIILHGTPERVLYLETDHLNTPIAASDENAKVVWKWESDAFGSTLPNEDPDKDGVKTTVNLRFPGQFYDKESGFHYNHHRYYDPQTGRYLSPDPIGLAGGRNSFGYVGGNPMGYVDPLGLRGNAGMHIAASELRRTYEEMLKKDVRGTDQFFHCLAACRATKKSRAPDTVRDQMNRKEWRDYSLNLVGQYGDKQLSHDDMIADMNRDKAANEMGIGCPPDVPCEQRCSPLLDDLLERRRPFMREYRTDW